MQELRKFQETQNQQFQSINLLQNTHFPIHTNSKTLQTQHIQNSRKFIFKNQKKTTSLPSFSQSPSSKLKSLWNWKKSSQNSSSLSLLISHCHCVYHASEKSGKTRGKSPHWRSSKRRNSETTFPKFAHLWVDNHLPWQWSNRTLLSHSRPWLPNFSSQKLFHFEIFPCFGKPLFRLGKSFF